ncbi:MAG: hypothetical protein Q7U36_04550 [bacterium]|nr:hypothetical protein [bacterium]
MSVEDSTIKSGEKPKVKAEQEAVFEEVEKSPEEIENEMLADSEKEVASFEREEKSDLESVEKKASADGLQIDIVDRSELEGLNKEAQEAKVELEKEISDKKENIEKNPTEEQQEAYDLGKKIVLKLQAEGNDKSPEYWALYSYLTEGLGKDITWRSAIDINVEKVKKMLDSKFPEKDQIVTRSCPKCGREYTSASASYCTACGGELEILKPDDESKMQERVVRKVELLSKEEASKKFLAEERAKLIEEIRIEIEKSNLSQENLDGSKEDGQYGKLSEMQSGEANAMAKRFSSGEELNEEDVNDEQENLEQLISNSEGLEEIKKKVEEHYTKADEIGKEKFENIQRSVEQTMLRSNCFFVHTINEDEKLRHNENSNVSSDATFEDDLDILLSLEPSISVSSINPGKDENGLISGLWSHSGGIILGGGQISEASIDDAGSVSFGIKDRRSGQKRDEGVSAEEIDKVAKTRRRNAELFKKGGYNEFVVNNPEVFGYFIPGVEDNEGKYWVGSLNIKEQSEAVKNKSAYWNDYKEMLERNISMWRKPIEIASKKGLPIYIKNSEGNFFECFSVNDDGTVEIGKQLMPEEVAIGKAGLSAEKRKEIGERLLQKSIFKKEDTIKEAEEIVKSL